MTRPTITLKERRGTIAHVYVNGVRVGLVSRGEIPESEHGALGYYAVAYDGTRRPAGSFPSTSGNTSVWARKKAAKWVAQHYLTHRNAA